MVINDEHLTNFTQDLNFLSYHLATSYFNRLDVLNALFSISKSVLLLYTWECTKHPRSVIFDSVEV
jgi:hypothetical protein